MFENVSYFQIIFILYRTYIFYFREYLNKQYCLCCRCYLPSGKIRWLCADHQEGNRVTVLSRDLAVTTTGQQLVTEYDILVRERILAHSHMANVHIKHRPEGKNERQNVVLSRLSGTCKKINVSFYFC